MNQINSITEANENRSVISPARSERIIDFIQRLIRDDSNPPTKANSLRLGDSQNERFSEPSRYRPHMPDSSSYLSNTVLFFSTYLLHLT